MAGRNTYVEKHETPLERQIRRERKRIINYVILQDKNKKQTKLKQLKKIR